MKLNECKHKGTSHSITTVIIISKVSNRLNNIVSFFNVIDFSFDIQGIHKDNLQIL